MRALGPCVGNVRARASRKCKGNASLIDLIKKRYKILGVTIVKKKSRDVVCLPLRILRPHLVKINAIRREAPSSSSLSKSSVGIVAECRAIHFD